MLEMLLEISQQFFIRHFHIRRIAHYGIEAACGEYAGKGSLKIKGVDFAADVFVLRQLAAHDVHDFIADEGVAAADVAA